VKDNRIPQEAFIGIVYAGSTAVAVLLLSHHPESGEILQHMISGSLLTVSPHELLKIAILYAVIGTFFFRFRHRFDLISTDRPAAVARGWKVVWWDFLFYAVFALVVTSSVAVAGVLLVFSLLVIPPVAALLLTPGTNSRLALGWTVAVVGGLGGILSSVLLDLPAGPAVIAALCTILVLVALWRGVARR
jgi:zinc/manganese transport system permease protein